MDALDELERMAQHSEQWTQAQEEAQAQADQPTVEPPSGGYGQLAREGISLVKGLVGFIEPRVEHPPELEDMAESELSPVLEKYQVGAGLAEEGGNIPFIAEVKAGFFLGGFFKNTYRQIISLWKRDKENAEKREHSSTEPAHTVPSEKWPREVPMPEAGGETTASE